MASAAPPHSHAQPATAKPGAAFTTDDINPNVVRAEYAVRGEVLHRATQIKAALARDPTSFPFEKLVECNLGNPQALRQKPPTFNRQVLGLLAMPGAMEWPEVTAKFPPDVIKRACAYLNAIPNGIGAYSESQGFPIVRDEVAAFIAARDGVPACKEDIILTDGASKAVQTMLKLLLRGPSDGVLVPIPQYPLYSATLTLENAAFVGYHLAEEAEWALPMEELERAVTDAKQKGVQLRALVVINPGNPTGNSLPLQNMEEVVAFCAKHRLVLMSDEVYQANIYDETRPFHSFKKVLKQMVPEPPLQLVSFHSTSKGFLGECGLRGGYMEIVGFDPAVKAQLLKLVSIGLCANTLGQISMGLMANPPREGDASYATYAAEKEAILSSLKRRAVKLVTALRQLEGVTCNEPQGALYAFPSLSLPPRAVAAAESAGKRPDSFYALQLLERTGIVVVPGSGFGQREGTWHFRTTFLPAESDMDTVITKMAEFHKEFMAQYA